ncbi:MAG: HAMP domain-containing sensor histidine kinase [Actinomycetota bacterium]|nr:HAMP domain-containing sensor histidine kinase [Actinomycetota bacterium]
MQKRIVLATAIVAVITLIVGVAALVVIRTAVETRAETELGRQAEVAATQIEEDLERLNFRPSENPGAPLARYRAELERSLARVASLGGHDIVEATIAVGQRETPITQPLVLIPLLPDNVEDGDVVTVEFDGQPMLVAIEVVDTPLVTLTVAIGRSQPLISAALVTVPVAIAVGVGAALIIGLGTWFGRSLSRRLRGLEDAATLVGGGNLEARSAVEGDDEIAAVAIAFNSMTEQLQAVRTREREFLMSVSHDLRTPLTTIKGYAEALDAGDIEGDDLARVAGVLNTQADQLSRLVEDVMLLGRLEARHYTMRPEPVDIAALVTGVSDGFAQGAKSSSVVVAVEAQEAGDRMVDPDRVTQILSNLIENALRYTPEMGVITISLVSNDDEFRVTVSNTGTAIAERDVPRVFDRLYVADRYRALRPSGSGLGLAIVAELVEAMGGTIHCESDETAGTAFEVKVPAERI